MICVLTKKVSGGLFSIDNDIINLQILDDTGIISIHDLVTAVESVSSFTNDICIYYTVSDDSVNTAVINVTRLALMKTYMMNKIQLYVENKRSP